MLTFFYNHKNNTKKDKASSAIGRALVPSPHISSNLLGTLILRQRSVRPCDRLRTQLAVFREAQEDKCLMVLGCILVLGQF